jgi:hypothetical protein
MAVTLLLPSFMRAAEDRMQREQPLVVLFGRGCSGPSFSFHPMASPCGASMGRGHANLNAFDDRSPPHIDVAPPQVDFDVWMSPCAPSTAG